MHLIQYKPFNNKMIQKKNTQQPIHYETNDEQLRLSISNINEIMQKINQAVRKSQSSLKYQDTTLTFVTQENLITENTENEDSELVSKLKNKINNMKIPLHQLHKKNKLSTVIQESQSQSGRSNKQSFTPRQIQLLTSVNKLEIAELAHSFTKNSLMTSSLHAQQIQTDDGQKKPKKITGIRKTSCLKTVSDHKNEARSQQPKAAKQNKQNTQKDNRKNINHKYTKTLNMASVKCGQMIQSLFSNHRRSKKIDEELESRQRQKENSKGRKGLSLLSKRSLKSQQSQKILSNIENMRHQKVKTTCSALSSQKKAKGQISIKRRSIHPFLMPKHSVQLDKKIEHKTKNCLSRTNIREFYVSKRINKDK